MRELSIEAGRAPRLWASVNEALGDAIPLGLRMWDGSHAGPVGAPTITVNDRRALRRLAYSPAGLGLIRAYVARLAGIGRPSRAGSATCSTPATNASR